MSDRQIIIDRIAKLLALSNSPNEHEAALAAERAQELLEKYNLSMEEIVPSNIGDIINIDGPEWENTYWESVFYNQLAKEYDCKAYTSGGALKVVGHASDVEVFLQMWVWLKGTIIILAYQDALANKVRPSNKKYIDDFCEGAARRVIFRMKKAKDERRQQSAGLNALVVRHQNLVEQWCRENLSLRGTPGKNRRHGEGFGRGYEAGDKIHLGQSLSGGMKQIGGGK